MVQLFTISQKKLSAPYCNLFYYYINTCYIVPKHGINEGHFEIFSRAKWDENTNELTKDLKSVLPQVLFENYGVALEKFNSLGEDPEYEEIEDLFDEQDFYAEEHSQEIENILRNYILRSTE